MHARAAGSSQRLAGRVSEQRAKSLVMACEAKAATITLQCQVNQCLMALYDLYTDVGNLGGQLAYGWKTHLYGRKRRTAVDL